MNAFLEARLDNVSAGTMTTGKSDTLLPVATPVPPAPPQTAAPPEDIYQFSISYKIGTMLNKRSFFIQGDKQKYNEFTSFLESLGIVYETTSVKISNIDTITAGLTFAVPTQTVRRKTKRKPRTKPGQPPKGNVDGGGTHD